MFTYRDSDTLADVQEADIEFLTKGPRNKIQYTNQPSYSDDGDTFPEATRNASTSEGAKAAYRGGILNVEHAVSVLVQDSAFSLDDPAGRGGANIALTD